MQFEVGSVEHSELMRDRIRVVSIVEAVTVTGPVKPLLMFSQRARLGLDGQRPVSHSLLTTTRREAPDPHTPGTLHAAAAAAAGLEVDTCREAFPFDVRVLSQMARFLDRRRPMIIETHDFKSHFLLSLLRRRRVALLGARWIAYHHGYTRMSLRVRAYQRLDSLSLPAADKVLTLCRPFVEQLVDRGVARDRIEVISNAVEEREPPAADALAKARHELGIAADAVVILAVGRLSPEKGQQELIAAYRKIAEAFPKARLLLVGDGGERARLGTSTRDLGDRVIFAGQRPDAWPFYHLASVFVLPSHTEGSPLVLFEAMAAGCPIVASAVGGIPETLEDGHTGLLVPPRDVAALTAAIQRPLADRVLAAKLGAAAHDAIRAHTPAAYASRLLNIYRGMLSAS